MCKFQVLTPYFMEVGHFQNLEGFFQSSFSSLLVKSSKIHITILHFFRNFPASF